LMTKQEYDIFVGEAQKEDKESEME
jgi:hypothetical protein